jgi:hypothetical protein
MYTLISGRHSVDYRVERRDLKAMRISVSPDQSVKVVAPQRVTIEKIEEKVSKKFSWILKNIEYFKSLPPKELPREYVSGETYIYMGRQYRLKVLEGNNVGVKLKGKFFYLTVKDPESFKEKQRLMVEWYNEKALDRYRVVLDGIFESLKKYELQAPSLRVRKMKSRWGSYSSKTNMISINSELIKAPIQCIEYLIMHEVCHIRHFKHDRKFYGFLTKVMPDWKIRKKRLERVVI